MSMLIEKIKNKKAKVGIIGLGYVGLPLVIRFCEVGFKVVGFDVDNSKVNQLNNGQSFIKHIKSEEIDNIVKKGSFTATVDFAGLAEVDCIIICVPTPLTETRSPDLSYVVSTAKCIKKYLKKGQMISLESTTYPGTTSEILLNEFSESGLVCGTDYYLVYSPEREDPGNPDFETKTIPKVVSGHTPACLAVATALYEKVVDNVIQVSSTQAGEFTKLLENIYRCINIALVNELKVIADKMDVNIWEVINAAASKPFGFKAFYPGPGLGGHCIPIDPFYLTWKAKEYGVATRFIELAGEINSAMPAYVISKVFDALNEQSKSIKGSKILIMGVAYKKDVDDMRESPSLPLINILMEKGAKVSYHDPFIPSIPKLRKYNLSLKSEPLTKETLNDKDIVLIATDHSDINYEWVAEHSKMIVDTRNALKTDKKELLAKRYRA